MAAKEASLTEGMRTMYERSYGYLYDGERRVKDDAANMRRHIKTMTKAGVLPADWRYSVRYSSFAGGCAIDIHATSPRPIYAADPSDYGWTLNSETGEHVHGWVDKLTREARAVRDTLNDLKEGHNHDGSEIQSDYFDVKFYGSVTLETVPGVPQYKPEPISA